MHKFMDYLSTSKCDNSKNVKVRSKSTCKYGRLLQHENVTMVRILK